MRKAHPSLCQASYAVGEDDHDLGVLNSNLAVLYNVGMTPDATAHHLADRHQQVQRILEQVPSYSDSK